MEPALHLVVTAAAEFLAVPVRHFDGREVIPVDAPERGTQRLPGLVFHLQPDRLYALVVERDARQRLGFPGVRHGRGHANTIAFLGLRALQEAGAVDVDRLVGFESATRDEREAENVEDKAQA